MRKTAILIGIAATMTIFSCRNIQMGTGSNYGYGMDKKENAQDSTGTHTVNDPDGITGSGSTYGTGAGVSGQTPAGTGSGAPNNGRSGVGIRATPRISK